MTVPASEAPTMQPTRKSFPLLLGEKAGMRASVISAINPAPQLFPNPVRRVYARLSEFMRVAAEFRPAYCRKQLASRPKDRRIALLTAHRLLNKSDSIVKEPARAAMQTARVRCSRLTAYSSLSWGFLLPTITDGPNHTPKLPFVKLPPLDRAMRLIHPQILIRQNWPSGAEFMK
jgi:hypothetical protein